MEQRDGAVVFADSELLSTGEIWRRYSLNF